MMRRPLSWSMAASWPPPRLSPARTGITTPNGHVPNIVLRATAGTKAGPTSPAFMPETVTRLATAYHTIPKSLKAAGYATGHFGKWPRRS